MRRFLLLGHTQRARPPLQLNDLPGLGGRWDLAARCVTNALLVSHGMRPDAEIRLLLQGPGGPRTLRIDSSTARGINPDERSTAAACMQALDCVDVGEHETSTRPGFHASARTLARNVRDLATFGPIVVLEEVAPLSIHDWAPPASDVSFVLGDHRDPTPEERSVLDEVLPIRLSLGPVALQADQCIAVVHNRLDIAKK